jgi:phosphoglycolate phosphatase
LEFLRFCQATRRRVFLLSATKETHVAKQSARLGLDPYFARLYAGVLDKRERIKQILEENFLAPNETAFIGDMVHDIETARHGGVKAIATLTGYDSAEKLSRAEPNVTVRDLGELQTLLEAPSAADEIRIEELEIFTRIGVPDEERAAPQRLTVSLTLQTRRGFGEMEENLARTVDYAGVCEELQSFVRDREDRLIETLADAMARHLIDNFEIARVEIELRKFILPATKFVAVRVARESSPSR